MLTAAVQGRRQFEEQSVEMITFSGPLITWLTAGLTIIVVGGIVFAGLALFVLIFRRWRMVVEIVSFWMLLSCSLRPAERLAEQFGLPAAATAIISVALFLACMSVIYGTVLDRFRFGLDWKSSRRVRVKRPIEEVWPAFALAECGSDANWEQILHDVQPVPGEPDSFDVSYLMGPSIFLKQRQTVLASDAPTHYSYRFSGDVHGRNRRLTDGEFDVKLEPDGKSGTLVTAFHHQKAMLPRTALALWFDDQLGDALDGFAARSRGKRDWSMTGLEHRTTLSLS